MCALVLRGCNTLQYLFARLVQSMRDSFSHSCTTGLIYHVWRIALCWTVFDVFGWQRSQQQQHTSMSPPAHCLAAKVSQLQFINTTFFTCHPQLFPTPLLSAFDCGTNFRFTCSVPTTIEFPLTWKSGNWRGQGKVGIFCWWSRKIASVVKLCNLCCNICLGQKHDELF